MRRNNDSCNIMPHCVVTSKYCSFSENIMKRSVIGLDVHVIYNVMYMLRVYDFMYSAIDMAWGH